MATSVTHSPRAAQLLTAARTIVAGGGLGAMTHRSVEGAAGVPHGSVTYWFGSRDGLLHALVDQLAADCGTTVAAIAERVRAGELSDPDQIAAELAAWMDANRELHVARFELELAGARDQALAAKMRATAQIFWDLCVPIAAALGSTDPRRDGRAMATMVDGLVLDRIARPEEGGRAVLTTAVAHLLSSWGPA